MSPSIEKLFAFECEFCQMSSPEYITKKIEEINLQEDLEDYEKRVKIREVCKAAPSSLPGIMSELSKYIDIVICLDMKAFFSDRNVQNDRKILKKSESSKNKKSITFYYVCRYPVYFNAKYSWRHSST